MHTAVITGGSGFVGQHLNRLLRSQGVQAFSLTANASEKTPEIEDLRLIDIRHDQDVVSFLEEVAPNAVYHLAAITAISDAAQNERAAFDVNVWGTRNVVRAASLLESPASVLMISTSQVYGDRAKTPINETALVEPTNTYAVTKAMAEIACRQYASKTRVVIARAFNHSGPGQADNFVLPFLAHQVALIEQGFIPAVIRTGDLKVKRDFTDVRDVVVAYDLLVRKGQSGEVYNVCSGKAVQLSDALDFLVSKACAKIVIEADPGKARSGQANLVVGDPEKIHAQTGWTPRISFEDMLLDLLDYWRSKVSERRTTSAAGKN